MFLIVSNENAKRKVSALWICLWHVNWYIRCHNFATLEEGERSNFELSLSDVTQEVFWHQLTKHKPRKQEPPSLQKKLSYINLHSPAQTAQLRKISGILVRSSQTPVAASYYSTLT